MTKEEVKARLLELQQEIENNNESLCDNVIHNMHNYDFNLGETIVPVIQDLRQELDSNIDWLFEEFLKLIDKLK